MANCPECDAEIEVDEFDVDKGDQLSCPECGSSLEVTGISSASAEEERRLVFDPTNLTDGIDLSADPILLARSAAYSISYDHRSKGT